MSSVRTRKSCRDDELAQSRVLSSVPDAVGGLQTRALSPWLSRASPGSSPRFLPSPRGLIFMFVFLCNAEAVCGRQHCVGSFEIRGVWVQISLAVTSGVATGVARLPSGLLSAQRGRRLAGGSDVYTGRLPKDSARSLPQENRRFGPSPLPRSAAQPWPACGLEARLRSPGCGWRQSRARNPQTCAAPGRPSGASFWKSKKSSTVGQNGGLWPLRAVAQSPLDLDIPDMEAWMSQGSNDCISELRPEFLGLQVSGSRQHILPCQLPKTGSGEVGAPPS